MTTRPAILLHIFLAAFLAIAAAALAADEERLSPADATGGDIFGYSVAISGSYAIVGAPRKDAAGPDSGAAYVFQRTGSDWAEMARPTDAAAIGSGDQIGSSVDISGTYAVAGSPSFDFFGSNDGAAMFFQLTSGYWLLSSTVGGSGLDDEEFGASVALTDTHGPRPG